MAKQQIAIRVDEELYAEYKIALLKKAPRRNVTQDLIQHMREVVEEATEQNKEKD